MGAESGGREGKRISTSHVARVTWGLGALIREERRKAGMGQEALAAAAGISQPALSYLENCRCFPKLETIERIATALGWRFEDFIAEARRRAALQPA